MTESTSYIIGAGVVVVLWGAWTLGSDTRKNHGMLVAFLMPLVLILMPLMAIVYLLIKYASYAVFLVLGRKDDHKEFLRKLKVRSGVFLLF